MKKKIIFLDADGTLWYPKTTKRSEKPHWVYHHPLTKDNYLEHLILAPDTEQTLKTLRDKGMRLVIVSAHPQTQETALAEMKEKLDYFRLTELFYSYKISISPDPADKASIMVGVLETLKLTKDDAVMVGDSYLYDYKPAQDAGIDAFLIDNPFSEIPDPRPDNIQSIAEITDLLKMLK